MVRRYIEMSVLAPLPPKELGPMAAWRKRVLEFDPSYIDWIDHSKRNPIVPLPKIFPQQVGICSCGCGQKLTGRKTRWAGEDCSRFAVAIYSILAGRTDTIHMYMFLYHGSTKCKCGDGYAAIDHIIPVKHCGGGCWLSNFQFLCHKCHVKKTNEDFGYKGMSKIQTELF
jgi:hypothetical protein